MVQVHYVPAGGHSVGFSHKVHNSLKSASPFIFAFRVSTYFRNLNILYTSKYILLDFPTKHIFQNNHPQIHITLHSFCSWNSAKLAPHSLCIAHHFMIQLITVPVCSAKTI